MNITKKDLNRTIYLKKEEIVNKRKWLKVDATDKILGRLATNIAKKLIGKDKSYYCDFWDCGDYIIVENAEKIAVTGNKLQNKVYYRHSGYKGHLKETNLESLLKKHPERAIMYAVRGMLPKNKLRDQRMKRLKIFVGKCTKYDNLSPELLETNG